MSGAVKCSLRELRRIHRRPDPEPMNDLAKLPIKFLKQAAKDGDATAQYELSRRYQRGMRSIPPNAKLEIEWCRKSAEQGHVAAEFAMATYYFIGYAGMDKDLVRSSEWMVKAAMQGHKEAESRLLDLCVFAYRTDDPTIIDGYQQALRPWLQKQLGGPQLH
jgi:TPR repeat protein